MSLSKQVMFARCLSISITLSGLLLTACGPVMRVENSPYRPHDHVKQRTNVSDKKTAELREQLEQKGVRIISIGQLYKISVSASSLFPVQSPKLRWGAHPLLNQLIAYVNQYRIVNLQVSSSVATNEGHDYKRNNALATARARALVEYLTRHHANARIIYTHGYNTFKAPITDCCDFDYRQSEITISFKNLIV